MLYCVDSRRALCVVSARNICIYIELEHVLCFHKHKSIDSHLLCVVERTTQPTNISVYSVFFYFNYGCTFCCFCFVRNNKKKHNLPSRAPYAIASIDFDTHISFNFLCFFSFFFSFFPFSLRPSNRYRYLQVNRKKSACVVVKCTFYRRPTWAKVHAANV